MKAKAISSILSKSTLSPRGMMTSSWLQSCSEEAPHHGNASGWRCWRCLRYWDCPAAWLYMRCCWCVKALLEAQRSSSSTCCMCLWGISLSSDEPKLGHLLQISSAVGVDLLLPGTGYCFLGPTPNLMQDRCFMANNPAKVVITSLQLGRN